MIEDEMGRKFSMHGEMGDEDKILVEKRNKLLGLPRSIAITVLYRTKLNKVKGKAIPVTGREGP
jgi:predicted transcriptional regulator